MQAYISISYSKRKQLDEELRAIIESLTRLNISAFVFVDRYSFGAGQEHEMMTRAFAAIDLSDLLIAEVSDKAIGIGVEVGYAKARGKTIIYVRRATAEHSSTVSGASDFQVIYNNVDDLQQQIRKILPRQ